LEEAAMDDMLLASDTLRRGLLLKVPAKDGRNRI
jgi:hypothetical protein